MNKTFKEWIRERFDELHRKLSTAEPSEIWPTTVTLYGIGSLLNDIDTYAPADDPDEATVAEWFTLLATPEYTNLRNAVIAGLGNGYTKDYNCLETWDVMNVVFEDHGEDLLAVSELLNSDPNVRFDASKYTYAGCFDFSVGDPDLLERIKALGTKIKLQILVKEPEC